MQQVQFALLPPPPTLTTRQCAGIGPRSVSCWGETCFAPTGGGAGGAAVLHQALLQFPERVAEYSLADQGLKE